MMADWWAEGLTAPVLQRNEVSRCGDVFRA